MTNACGGPDVYCPVGSVVPLKVGVGNYSTVTMVPHDDDNAAPAFLLSITGAGVTDASDVRAGQRVCEPGYWCFGGVRRPCPAGTYGSSYGLSEATCNGLCPPGMYCIEASTEAKPVSPQRRRNYSESHILQHNTTGDEWHPLPSARWLCVKNW